MADDKPCSEKLAREGVSYPWPCPTCGTGPCQAKRPDVDRTLDCAADAARRAFEGSPLLGAQDWDDLRPTTQALWRRVAGAVKRQIEFEAVTIAVMNGPDERLPMRCG